ncbi:InlB B-repeat-containing protein, partial [Intestinibacter sp.]|uniref:InlB B-repeat-containing protein n=1 Tax=Intestinibacter sp. TaxID=1965304 RepID=UPI003F18D713
LPMYVFAEENINVRVIIENTTLEDAAFTGRLVDTEVQVPEGSSVYDAFKEAADKEGVDYVGAGYISSINGLSNGWMVTLNDWFINVGANNQTVEDNDEVAFMYSCNLGEDLGGTFYNNDKTLKDIKTDLGTLSPAFSSDVKEYELKVPTGTKQVVVTPTATNKNFQVRASVDDVEYKRAQAIPVKDGTVISVKCGDPEWPSMNNQAGGTGASVPAETYKIKIVESEAEGNMIDVTFDADNGTNAVVKSVKSGEALNYTPKTPTKKGYTFVGWYKDTDDITTEYKSGIINNQDVTYKAKWAHVEMLGAQAKTIVDNKSGIRFGTKLYNDGDEVVEKGTLIIPANLLSEGESLTLYNKKAARSIGKVNYEVNKEENYVTYLGTIVNIPKSQFLRQMTAASYVIYKDKAGNKYTVYSQYPNGSVSIYDLLGKEACEYQVLFNVKPEDATITVKDNQGNVVEASEGAKYLLIAGDYTYEVKKSGYEIQKGEFQVKDKDLELDVELQNAYNVSFTPNVSKLKNYKLEVYKDGELVEPQEDGNYLLTNGKYTYKASARGYDEVNKEFEVDSSDLSLTVEFAAAPYDISWYDADKTSFEISTAEQLAGLGAIVNGCTDINDTFGGKTITVTKDIKVNGILNEWLSIGDGSDYSKTFDGIFDGDNHTITVKINTPNDDYVGLFGYTGWQSEVKNLTVEGSIIGKNNVGAVTGVAHFMNGLENCVNKATVTGETNVGGIVGNASIYSEGISNCINKGEVKGNASVGGICGYTEGCYVENSFNEGNVAAESNVGGIIGNVYDATILNSNNSGNITANNNYAGGIIGKDEYGGSTVINDYNTGTIKGDSYIGGISGQNNSRKIANDYNLGEVIGTGKYIGGIVGANSNAVKNCYNLGKVSASENSTNVSVIAERADLDNCYYINTFTSYTENQGTALPKEDFENGNLASKLNDNLALYYSSWTVKDNVTTFTGEPIQIVFDEIYESSNYEHFDDYTVELKDSEGNVIKPYKEGVYAYSNLKLNETYTYTVKAKGCEPTTKTYTYEGDYEEIDVRVSYIKTTTTLKSNVENTEITVYDKYNDVVEPNEDGTYSLAPGEYTYKALADGYSMAKDKFTIDVVENDESKEINIEMTKGYDVNFESNSTTGQTVEVRNSSDVLMETKTPNKYNLAAGKYTYTLRADGYETVNGEFEIVDKDLGTISVELKKVYDLSWYDSEKTEYTLNTKEELLGFNAILNNKTTSIKGQNFSGKTIKLGKDIVLNSDDKFTKNSDGSITVSDDAYIWESSGTFAGTFDGNGCAIKGLYMGDAYYQALFKNNNGTIKNLTVTGYLKGSYVGGIAVYNYGTIDSCTNKVTMECTNQYGNIGGIVSQSNSKVINCTNLGEVKGYRYTGGIVGSASNSVLKNNVNKAAVSSIGDSASNIGGIAGSASYYSEVSNNYNLGDVTGASNIGGIVGNTNSYTNSTIKNNVNYGNIKADTKSGSIIGYIDGEDISKLDLANNFYQNGTFDGGIMGKDIEGKVEAKTSEELSDGSVSTLLNSAVTDENGYKSWEVIDGKTVFKI